MPNKQIFIEAMAKHLPPSASHLRLLDMGAVVGETLLELRPDLDIQEASLNIADWDYAADSFDAVVAYDLLLKESFLEAVLYVLREGGRLIVLNPLAQVDEALVAILEKWGYVRILVEDAVAGAGVLIRGEKAHLNDNTLERVRIGAEPDADLVDLDTYKGRFIHLLIQQSPNKPVWQLSEDEKIEWQAIAFELDTELCLLAFSSLPKAVNFMQPAVLEGLIFDVNKVGKFSIEEAKNWPFPIVLNPIIEQIKGQTIRFVEIDPNTAASPDE